MGISYPIEHRFPDRAVCDNFHSASFPKPRSGYRESIFCLKKMDARLRGHDAERNVEIIGFNYKA